MSPADLSLAPYNGLGATDFYLSLFGLLVGTLWLFIGIYLQYGRPTYSKVLPMECYLIGSGLLLLVNPLLVNIRHRYAFSIFLSVLGFVVLAVAPVVLLMWLLFDHSIERVAFDE